MLKNEESEEKTLENEPNLEISQKLVPNVPKAVAPPTSSLPVISNHISSSQLIIPTSNSTTNSNWNSDSWADGEFEPLDDDTFTGNNVFHLTTTMKHGTYKFTPIHSKYCPL